MGKNGEDSKIMSVSSTLIFKTPILPKGLFTFQSFFIRLLKAWLSLKPLHLDYPYSEASLFSELSIDLQV